MGSSADGLSMQDAAKRLAIDGFNELKEIKKNNALHIFQSV
ncbi:MAG: cation-transporting P-type ATPase [Chromatiales bacterium]|nr:cation-transporting P-type ATPase [Chromatiales bacterium]